MAKRKAAKWNPELDEPGFNRRVGVRWGRVCAAIGLARSAMLQARERGIGSTELQTSIDDVAARLEGIEQALWTEEEAVFKKLIQAASKRHGR